MIYNVKILSLISLLILLSCSQEPASISYKGHLSYNQDETKPLNVAKFRNKTKINSLNNLGPNEIRVAKGDTMHSLARSHKVPLRELIEKNDLKPPYAIYPGDIIEMPNNRRTHIVKRGENLTLIARNYDVSIPEIAAVNNFSSQYKVKINEVIILPYEAKLKNKSIISKTYSNRNLLGNKSNFIWPIKGNIIKNFGANKDGTYSDGINIKATAGANIKSIGDGKVVYVGSELRGYGNLIIIKHPGNWLAAYAHSEEIFVEKEQIVKKGEVIATIGSSGHVKSPQLHFGLRKGRKAVDPIKYLSKS